MYVTNDLGLYAWEDIAAMGAMAACGTVCVYLFGCQVSLGHPPSHQVSSLCCKADPWHDPSKSPESGLHALVLLVLSTIATSVSTNTAMPFGWFSNVLHFSGLITHLWTHILQHIPSPPVPWTSKALLSSHWNKEAIYIARAIIQMMFLFTVFCVYTEKMQILPKQEKHIRRPAANPTLTPPILITPPVSSWNSCQPILSKRFRGSVPYMQPLECGCFLQNSCALPGGACLCWLMTCQELRGPHPCGRIPKTYKWQWQPT